MPGYKRNSRTRRRFPIRIETKTAKRIIVVSIPIIIIATIFLGARIIQENVQLATQKQEQEQTINKLLNEVDYSKIEGEKPVEKDEVINIIALGNIICEPELYEKMYDETNETYLFIKFLNRVQEYIGVADYTIANLETNFVNILTKKKDKPVAPKDLAFALKNMGVDLLNTASPYSNDYGREGIEETIQCLNDFKLEHIGTYTTQGESEKTKIVDLRTIKVAFLSYTQNLNTLTSAKEKYLVNRLDENKIIQDINSAKQQGAEFVFVCLNWGDIKADKPTNNQKELANRLVDNGADFIIGTHPNMAFEIEERNNKEGKKVCIIYSLGNFISLAEKMQISLDIEITKALADGKVSLTNVKYTPMYLIDKGENAQERYLLTDVNQEISRFEANVQSNLTQEDYELLQTKIEELRNRLKTK